MGTMRPKGLRSGKTIKVNVLIYLETTYQFMVENKLLLPPFLNYHWHHWHTYCWTLAYTAFPKDKLQDLNVCQTILKIKLSFFTSSFIPVFLSFFHFSAV